MDRTTCVIMIDQHGRVLMQHRDNKAGIYFPDYWSVPGGLVEQGESIEQGARREFLEETGYQLSQLVFLYPEHRTRPDGSHVAVHFFWTRYDENQPVQCYEGQAMRFVAPAEFPQLKVIPRLEPTLRQALQAWEQEQNVM